MTDGRPQPRISAIATAVPAQEIDSRYCDWASARIADPRQRKLFDRMAARSGIDARYTVLGARSARFEPDSFYGGNAMPGTAERMRVYAEEAPRLAIEAISRLPDTTRVTHFVTASCTGFLAPGLDQVVSRQCGFDPQVERVAIGFMGCYAGVTALRTAAHIVRADPAARVLVVAVELCTLHMQDTGDIESLLAMRQFADGAAAAMITGEGEGLMLGDGISATLEDSQSLMNWRIGDHGFVMHLSGAVPGRIAEALEDRGLLARIAGPESDRGGLCYAVHPGGRSILDAVERGLGLADDALEASRAVLSEFGNMSSATILFVLARIMEHRPEKGVALAFGPGLALEGLRFGWTDDARSRRQAAELMDDPALPEETFAAILADLARVNRATLAYRPTLDFLDRCIGERDHFSLLDVGYGHGDMLRQIAHWARERGIVAELVGIDLDPRSEPAARAATSAGDPITYLTGDYADLGRRFDCVVSSLVAHHMTQDELLAFLYFMEAEARAGWFVNDLHRHSLSYFGYPWLARAFGWHEIVRRDGQTSIARAFRPGEWRDLLAEAGVAGARIERKFPFRLCVSRIR